MRIYAQKNNSFERFRESFFKEKKLLQEKKIANLKSLRELTFAKVLNEIFRGIKYISFRKFGNKSQSRESFFL